jgi:hypothetical protein
VRAKWGIPTAVTDQRAFDELVQTKAGTVCEWVDDRRFKQAKKGLDPAISNDEHRKRIDKARVNTLRGEVLDRVVAILQKNYPQRFGQAATVRSALGSDPELNNALGP